MLNEFSLENFILIKRAEISFPKGLIAITGETGAGKSIFIKAIKVLLGDKFSNQYIKPNEENSIIQASINISDEKKELLDKYDISSEDGEIIIRRSVTKSGRNKNIISGIQISTGELKEILEDTISIVGQHEGHNLLNEKMHLYWLDLYSNLTERVKNYQTLFYEWISLRRELEEKLERKKQINLLYEKLSNDAKKIDDVSPKKDEDIILEQEIKLLKSSAQLINLGNDCYKNLYEQKGSVLDSLHKILSDLQKMSSIDSSLEKLVSNIEASIFSLQEVSHSLRDYLKNLPKDLTTLEKKEDRYYSLKELKRYFALELNEIIERRRDIDREIKELENNDVIIQELSDKIQEKEANLIKEAILISDIRKENATKFSKKIEEGLDQLKMKGTTFLVEVTRPENPTSNDLLKDGIDKVTFMFSANPGSPLKPLKEIASGGELSRVMLTIRELLIDLKESGTIIFDEIDSGLSAEVAELVGQKLKRLSERMQVIVITHFPQIAALADCHLLVRKNIGEGDTNTEILALRGEDRVLELARMLGGIREETINLARNLLLNSMDDN